MRIIKTETEAYTFDELSGKSKEKALDNYRDINVDHAWWYATYEMIEQAATILGIEIGQKPVKLMNGETRYNPAIYFSGFYSQGDGACFEGTYSYAKGAVKAIKAEFPSDETLHRIAADLQAVQAKEFYLLEADVTHRGHYYHYNSVDIEVYRSDDQYRDLVDGSESGITEALRSFCKWIYKRLNDEYDYLTSDEVIKETIESNEWEFTEDGVSI
jgi:hypothetical protein